LSVTGWIVGCEVKVPSLLNPGKQMNYNQFNLEIIAGNKQLSDKVDAYNAAGETLQNEIEAFNASVEQTDSEFQRQFEIRQKAIEFTGGLVGSALSGNPISVAETVSSAAGLLVLLGGVGAIADKKRADGVIKDLKNGSTKV
jgi:hypothetical protein